MAIKDEICIPFSALVSNNENDNNEVDEEVLKSTSWLDARKHPLLLLYSSGTTGRIKYLHCYSLNVLSLNKPGLPKGALNSHYGVLAAIYQHG